MNAIGYFEIQASEPERLAEFYADVFGWHFTERKGMPVEYRRIETAAVRSRCRNSKFPVFAGSDILSTPTIMSSEFSKHFNT